MTEHEMNLFYRSLGMRSLRAPRGANVRHALAWTPVIYTSIHGVRGHALVAAGFNEGQYEIVNPCSIMSVDFEADVPAACSAGTTRLAAAQLEAPLGSFIWYW